MSPAGRPVRMDLEEGDLAGAWFGPEYQPGATAIVLLHEGLGSISMWADFPDALAAAFDLPVFAYERQGHGSSGRPVLPRHKEWMHHEALSVLPAVLANQDISNPLIFSHSDGATIGLIYAAHHPVRGIVSEAAHVFQDDMMEAGGRRATGQWAHGVLRKLLAEHHGDNAEMLLTGWLDWWRLARRQDWNLLEELQQITAPVLAIQGTEDAYGTPEQVATICERAAGPAEELFLDGIGHIAHHEARAVVLETMSSWVARHRILAD